jgi:hypothetical protein
MPGFVDVSNMTDEEVRRLGHADDPAPRYSRSYRPPAVMLNTPDVFVAVAAAHRINQGANVKTGDGQYVEGQGWVPNPLTPNRVIIEQVLAGEIQTTDQDREFSQLIMSHYQGLTIKILAGKVLNEFEQKALHLASSEKMDSRNLGIAASLASGYARAAVRQSVDDRLADCERSYVGTIGAPIILRGEVVKCVYSQQWNTYYITMITDDNHNVFFGVKRPLANGSKITVQGKVKAHRDGFTTQLNYAKVVSLGVKI